MASPVVDTDSSTRAASFRTFHLGTGAAAEPSASPGRGGVAEKQIHCCGGLLAEHGL